MLKLSHVDFKKIINSVKTMNISLDPKMLQSTVTRFFMFVVQESSLGKLLVKDKDSIT